MPDPNSDAIPPACGAASDEPKARRVPLNRHQVLTAASRLVDTEGLDALTMRRPLTWALFAAPGREQSADEPVHVQTLVFLNAPGNPRVSIDIRRVVPGQRAIHFRHPHRVSLRQRPASPARRPRDQGVALTGEPQIDPAAFTLKAKNSMAEGIRRWPARARPSNGVGAATAEDNDWSRTVPACPNAGTAPSTSTAAHRTCSAARNASAAAATRPRPPPASPAMKP